MKTLLLPSVYLNKAQAWTAAQTFNDNVEWRIGTAGGESTIKSDGTSTIWTIASGKRLDLTFAGSGGFQYSAGALAFQETTTISTSAGALTLSPADAVVITVVAAAANGSLEITSSDPTIRFKATGAVVADQNTYEWRTIGAANLTYLQLRKINDAETVFTELLSLWNDGHMGLGITTFANVSASGSISAAGGIAFTDVANAWIDDATHGNGTVVHYIGNNTINTTAPSDIRLKDNISSLDALGILLQLPVIEFESEHWGPGRWGGFDAQAAGRVLPNLAMQDTQGYWRFQGHLLMPYVVGGMQEIMGRVKTLERENQELRALVAGRS